MPSERITESEIGLAILTIAALNSNGIATFNEIRTKLPDILDVGYQNRRISVTRPNEELWEQQIRNIKSHDQNEGNILHEGYALHIPRIGFQITPQGRDFVRRNK